VLIGIFLSFVLYVPRAARVHLTELTLASGQVIRERIPSDPRCGRIRMFSLEGEMFFGAAPELEQHLELIEQTRLDGVRVVILRMKRARNPDGVCLQVLDRFIERMRWHSVTVVLCAIRPDMMKALEAGRVLERLGQEHVFVFQETGAIWTSTLEAVRFAYERIGADKCATCPRGEESETAGWSYAI
jgi:SulP family sulfate permease